MIDYAARAAVLGATGYAGRELVGLLARHPRVRLAEATSESEAGGRLRSVAPGAPDLTLVRAEDVALDGCDVVFSCLPHGEGGEWVRRAREAGARVIDLSADLRVKGPAVPAWADGVVYGLPELFRGELTDADLIANPGCYPTGVLLALAPLLRRGLVSGALIVNAASGVTGAGRTPRRDLLFGEVAEDFRAYGVGNGHRHLPEMRVHAGRVAGLEPELVFTPHLLPVRRGILATIYAPLAEPLAEADARALWSADYGGEPFVEVLAEGTPSLAAAVGTNRVVIGVAGVSAAAPALMVVAAIDNLLKGAAGQAVQNMNLSFGWPETEGLPC